MPSDQSVRIFTIVSKNYLHYAIVLMESLAAYLPEARLSVILCDRSEGLDTSVFPFEVIELESLAIPHLDRLLYHYTILELNTAIKPFVFSHLMERGDATKIIYFDPDIKIYSDLAPMVRLLDRHDILLTPHLTDFLDDDRHPSDLSILQSGTYNLGFLALRCCAASERMLSWWQGKLLRDCVVDIPRGLFTDQKWIDLVPGIVERVGIIRHSGWNVAYWNLKHRQVEQQDGEYCVNGEPLVFFHFSGYVVGNDSISKHQDRFRLSALPEVVRQLFTGYAEDVAAAGQSRFASLGYAFATLHDGTPLPDMGRALLRMGLDWSRPHPDLRTAEGAALIVRLLNRPVDSISPTITALADTLYQRRQDLQMAFPDYLGAHRVAFGAWFVQNAGKEEQVAPVFVAPMMEQHTNVATHDGAAAPETPPPASLASRFFQAIYRVAWKQRALARPLLQPETRTRIRNLLLQRAYAAPAAATGQSSPALPADGMNIIGYIRAESGVGESARCMIRTLEAADIPYSLTDFRTGNISRMGEQVDDDREQGVRYGVSLFHVNADQILLARDTLGSKYFGANTYRVGYWAWELPEFPEIWQNAFTHLDEIWVPSTFCQNAVAACSPLPVVCIPHAIDVERQVTADRARFGLSAENLIFFTMADMLSVPERKNPLGAVEAFARAFPAGNEPVTLVVKISNSEVRPDILAVLQDYCQRLPTILLLDGYLDRAELYTLIESSDVFVSLHRSEGFGLGIAEAMSRGKAVVATGWSGNMDFMTVGNSLVVDHRLIQLERDLGPYRQGSVWADPDPDQAAYQMQRLLAEPDLRRELGKRALADCRRQLAPAAVGKLARQRLNRIRKRLL